MKTKTKHKKLGKSKRGVENKTVSTLRLFQIVEITQMERIGNIEAINGDIKMRRHV